MKRETRRLGYSRFGPIPKSLTLVDAVVRLSLCSTFLMASVLPNGIRSPIDSQSKCLRQICFDRNNDPDFLLDHSCLYRGFRVLEEDCVW
jgi:hypothetical protein